MHFTHTRVGREWREVRGWGERKVWVMLFRGLFRGLEVGVVVFGARVGFIS